MPVLSDFMVKARAMWVRDQYKWQSIIPEERHFHQIFGISHIVDMGIWVLVSAMGIVPYGGYIHRLIWTLFFMK